VIGVYFVFVLTWVVAWLLVWQDFQRSDRLVENGMRYMWLITIGVVVATAVLLGECL